LSSFAALYMAPEQFRGITTPLSDQYALACLTYELLTGKPPFEAEDSMSLARQHTTKEPKLPSLRQPACEPFDQALLKALVKRPEGRHADILEFLAALNVPAVPVSLVTAPEETPGALPLQVESTEPDKDASEDEAPAPQAVAPLVSGIAELETIKQPALKLASSVVLTGVHEAVTFVTRAGRTKAQAGASQQFKALPALAQPAPISARARPTARRARRQIWLVASLVLLVLVASISSLALIVNAAIFHQNIASAGTTATPTHTLATNQPSPVISTPDDGSTATATATPVTSKPKPTATPKPKPTVTPTPTPTPTAKPPVLSCKVSYHVSDQWTGGFIANLTITNTGTSTINGWTLTFTFPDHQQVLGGWNGHFSQSGARVTITNANSNGTLQPGASTRPGFQGSFYSQNNTPTSFMLNGVACQ
ncbi:MAG TPA: cellulose binding domain-containing protein, partial [Ktedonobacteraceae bacterium]